MAGIDVLIVAALPEELAAARDARNGLRAWRDHGTGTAMPYQTGQFVTVTGAKLEVALARPTEMGGRSLGAILSTLIHRLRPVCVAMPGVCAGRPGSTTPGDVIVAQRTYQYDEGKWEGGTFFGSHDKSRLNRAWLRVAQDFRADGLPSHGTPDDTQRGLWFLERLLDGDDPRKHVAFRRYYPPEEWRAGPGRLLSEGLIAECGDGWTLTDEGRRYIERVVANDVYGPDTLPFAVVTGPMASGNAVIEREEVWRELRDMGERKITGIEMEAATVAALADELGVPHWLVAKGVMDHAGAAGRKTDRFKEFAARASAEVLFALLTRLIVGTPREPGGFVPADSQRISHRLPGAVSLELIRRLADDWLHLAVLAGVEEHDLARIANGDGPRKTLSWLDMRNRGVELPGLLDGIGRPDLADLVRPHVPPE